MSDHPSRSAVSRTFRAARQAALKIALLFLVFGGLWIFLSDRLLELIVGTNVFRLTNFQTLKGLLFITGTSAMLYWLVWTAVRQIGQRDEALRQSEERFGRLIHIAEEGIWASDARGVTTFVNPKMAQMVGYTPAEMVGQPITLVIPPDRHEEAWRMLREQNVPGRYEDDARFRRKDGSEFWASVVSSLIYDDEGAFTGVLAMVSDITERKRAEQSVRELNEQLETRVKERTAQLGEANEQLEAFAYSVSHDLQAPLRSMQSAGNRLLEQYAHCLDEEGQNQIRRMVASAVRMSNLTQDLLEYALVSRAQIKLERVNLGVLVTQIVGQLESELTSRGAAICVDEPLYPVMAHRRTLAQVVQNLLSNAIKFVRPGVPPRVTVRTEMLGEEGVRLWVEDNGIGIPADQIPHIFEVFHRVHEHDKYPGTGIGLAIVKRAVERMGGSVGLESEEGHGSRFWVELAAAPEM